MKIINQLIPFEGLHNGVQKYFQIVEVDKAEDIMKAIEKITKQKKLGKNKADSIRFITTNQQLGDFYDMMSHEDNGTVYRTLTLNQ